MSSTVKIGPRTLVFGVLLLSLWATITNFLPLSVTFAALAPAIPYLLLQNKSLPRPVILLLILYAYFVLSTLFYAPASFLDPGFYRRDGNVFITYLPILLGGMMTIRIDVQRLVIRFLKWATVMNFVFILIFLATGGTLFIHEHGIYHFLFEAHNAAGGYLATLLGLSLGLYFGKGKTLQSFLMILVNLTGLVLTVSRGSVLGLVLAIILVLVLRERLSKLAVIGMAAATIAVVFYTYPTWVSLGRPAGLFVEEGASLFSEELAAGDANILDRVMFLWPRAIEAFFQSPIVGTGFGSFDDLPPRYEGIPHVLAYNVPTELNFSSSHAHHTYLHVLAETGIVGLGLLIIVLYSIRKSIDTFEHRSVRLGLSLVLWIAIFASATEHRLFTPSQMLPFTILFGLALANSRWVAKHGAHVAEVKAALDRARHEPPSADRPEQV